jgi:acetyltransferase-like isoleucine patch superfamily enzyme
MDTWNKILNKLISIINKMKKKEALENNPFFSKDYTHSNNIVFGDFTYGNPEILQWNEGTRLNVGKFCSIAGNVKIFLGGNHRADWLSTYPFNSLSKFFPESVDIKGHPISKGDVLIGSDVWLADSCVILSGVKIGHGAIVGANSVVSKDIEPYQIYAGNPAKLIRNRFDESDTSKLLEMKWWDWETQHIKSVTNLLCSDNISGLYDYFCKNIKDSI